MIVLPDSFIEQIKGVHKQKGEVWLRDFGRLIEYCENKWGIRVLPHFPLSFNFVAPVVYADGTVAVLKLKVPEEINTEAEALRLYNGRGAAKLLAAEDDKGIMILERLRPGNTLKSIQDDEEATLIAAEVMRKIHTSVSVPSRFPTACKWAEGFNRMRSRFNGGSGPIPEKMANKAEQMYKWLCKTICQPVLLHGDLHHENILSADRETWLAIDPASVIGEAEYGVTVFLMNHLPKERPLEITRRRIELFVDSLRLNKERVLAWAFSHAVLSTWWCIEDQTPYVEEGIETAEMFERLLVQ